MSQERFRRIKDLFARACDLPVGEQAAFLARECAGDDALRGEIESLLAADRTPASGLDTPVPDQHPDRIGGYRILGVIGRGGMGTVYEAEQDSPRRRVALKVMSFSSPELLKRFEYEAEILGRLRHPGIAQIYEAGVADGQPFFAMERIDGVPLTEFAKGLPAREKLALLTRICEAVQHAHQQGVIHRDLKPGNILVESGGAPRLLDFGIAKLAGPDAQLQTLATRAGQLLGTLPYMSPEQFAGEADVRADVYALGVIAYELMAGRTPKDFSEKSLKEAMVIAQSADTPRLGTLAADTRGDVETIVGKALERDKERRYGSAGELAADIRRYLDDQPIVARPPSAGYQLRKLARRHRAVFAGVAIALIAIIGGGIFSVTQYFKKEAERRKAVAAQHETEQEREKAVAAKELAEARAETRDEVVGFLVGLFDVVDPAEARGRTVTAKEILDSGAAKIERALDKQPEVRSQLMLYIGSIYVRLGLVEQAAPLVEKALEIRTELFGKDHKELGHGLIAMADIERLRGNYDTALQLVTRAEHLGHDLRACHEARGEIHFASGGYRFSENFYRKALAIRDTEKTRAALALTLRSLGRFDEAERLAREALDAAVERYGDVHPAVVARRSTLGGALAEKGALEEAEEQLRKAVEGQEKLTGKESVDVSYMLNNQAAIALERGAYGRAKTLLLRALEISMRWRGANHPKTIGIIANLGAVAQQERRLEDALRRYRAALAAQRAVSGDRHPNVITYLVGVGGMLGELRRYEEAKKYLTEGLELARKLHGPKSPDVTHAMGHLAALARQTGDLKTAEKHMDEAYALALEIWGAGTPEVADHLYQRGKLYVEQGKWKKAKTALLEALEIYRAKTVRTAAERMGCTSTLATVATELGEYKLATGLLAESLAAQDEAHGRDSESAKPTLATLARLYQMQGDYVRARPLFERLMKNPPKDPMGRAAITNNYALVLLLLDRAGAAEKLFREARTVFQGIVGPSHPAIGTLTHNVAECLRVRGEPEADAEFEKALRIFRGANPAHPQIPNSLTKLGLLRKDRALVLKALELRRAALPKGHPDIAKTLVALGDAASLEEAVAIFEKALPGSPLLAEARSDLAARRIDEKRFEEAKTLLEAAKPVLERSLGRDHPAAKRARERLQKIP